MSKHSSHRLWEIDVIRFFALSLMLVQHITIIWIYVLNYQLGEYPQYINLIGRIGALLFLFLVGFSGFLSYKKRQFSEEFSDFSRHFFLRGIAIFGWGMLLTLATFFVVPEQPIWFGVLHFIGIAVITLPFFIKYKFFSRVFILISIIIGVLAINILPLNFWFLPLGFVPTGLSSLDYWPYFPWISVVIAGLEVARYLIDEKNLSKLLFSRNMPSSLKLIQRLGSHTLLIYLVHVPIFAVIFWVIRHYFNI